MQPTDVDVEEFLRDIPHERKRADSLSIVNLMSEATGEPPIMWGKDIVGFGSYRYQYASGEGGKSPLTAFSPRKQSLTIYIMSGFEDYEDLLSNLGKFKTGRVCLYINRLSDIDIPTLRRLIRKSTTDVAAGRTYKRKKDGA